MKKNDRSSSTLDAPYTREIPEEEWVGVAIVETVAAVSDTPVMDVEPLAGTIDPEALEAIVTSESDATVEFDYCDWRVTVTDERITVEQAER